MLAVGITVITVAVIIVMSVFFIRTEEHDKSEHLLLLLCETGERNLDYYFNSVEKSVREMATITESDLKTLDDDELEKHTERIKAKFEVIANKTNGVMTYYYRIDPSVSEKVKGFWFVDPSDTGFTEHEVTDITQYDTEDTSRLVWFTVPKFTGKPVWLPPYKTENLDVDEVISYNYPIYLRGRFVGVIGIEIDYTVMKEQIESIKLYNNGYAFLTDSSGNLIYHPRIHLADLAEESIPPVPEGLLSESTFTRYSYGGTEKVAAWMRLNNGMRLYVSIPKSETQRDWQRLILMILIAAVIVLALSVLLTWFFTGRITRPLKQLTDAAALTDQGNYDFTLDYNGDDEIGTLTRTFKRMADHMKDHISDLSRRANVDALTSVRNKGAFTTFIEDMQKKLDEEPDNAEFAIGMFDCDDLKTVNDKYGHDKGDIYLKTASRVICKTFQHSPVFRIGGDEFAVILRGDDYRDRGKLATTFRNALESTCAGTMNYWEKVHVAMGIAVYDPQQDHSVVDTMRRADKIMYVNKRKHKTKNEV